ncbi:MAG: endospore germination permease [Clostridiales bacterium]|nr:endospore germination permease [Clostridiales bacterium]
MKKPLISASQLLFMAVGSALVFPYTFLPVINAPPANQDAWIVLLLAVFYIIVLSVPILFLAGRFRGLHINDMLDIVYGKLFGKVAAMAFSLFFIFCLTACMLIISVFINLYAFPDTPMWAILLLSLVPISYGAYKGAGTISRLAFLITPFIIFTIILFFLLGLKEMRLSELEPVLGDSTFLQLNLGAFLTAARYSEILIILVFSYFLKDHISVSKTFIAALAVFALTYLLILIPTITFLGIELAKHDWNPYFIFTRQVEAYDFIERAHAFNLLAWYPTSLLKLMIYNFMGSFVLSNIFKTKTHKPFVIPLSLVCAIVCLIPLVNDIETVEMLRSDKVFPFIIIPIIWIIPLITLIVYALRRKKINDILEEKKQRSDNPAPQEADNPIPENG